MSSRESKTRTRPDGRASIQGRGYIEDLWPRERPSALNVLRVSRAQALPASA